MKKVLVAMSGGVDSSVAALLLKEQGYEVAGAYMKTWMNEEEVFGDCPWLQDIEDARAAAETIGIDFEVVNFIGDYRERVVHYMVEGYRRGVTPNPDVMCNREMKFGVFLDYAREKGFEGVATGHYCRKRENANGSCDLVEGADKNKDQSYFLAMVRQEQLQRAFFPIGELPKPEVRRIARAHGLPNADKKDSQGICFLGKVRIADFLGNYIPDSPGDVVNPAGKVLGKHQGLHRFTLGQRKGIGIPSNTDNEAYVVVGKDLEKNRLIVAFDKAESPGLYTEKVRLHHLSFLNRKITGAQKLLSKPRFRDPSTPVKFVPTGEKEAEVHFNEAQRALAPGQVCALYDNEVLLGGGIYY